MRVHSLKILDLSYSYICFGITALKTNSSFIPNTELSLNKTCTKFTHETQTKVSHIKICINIYQYSVCFQILMNITHLGYKGKAIINKLSQIW